MASSDTSRKTLDITGPAILTGTDLANALSDVVGKTIHFAPITLEQKKAGLLASGMPEFVAELLASFDDAVAKGLLAVQSDAVAALTGKPAQSVKDFPMANREALMAS